MKKQMNAIKSRNSIKSLFSPTYAATSNSSHRKRMTLHHCPDVTLGEMYASDQEPIQESGEAPLLAEAVVKDSPLPQGKPGKPETVWVADCVLTGGRLPDPDSNSWHS